MTKRTTEQLISDVRRTKSAVGISTFSAMAGTLNDEEWDDLIDLLEKLQKFWKMHADPVSS